MLESEIWDGWRDFPFCINCLKCRFQLLYWFKLFILVSAFVFPPEIYVHFEKHCFSQISSFFIKRFTKSCFTFFGTFVTITCHPINYVVARKPPREGTGSFLNTGKTLPNPIYLIHVVILVGKSHMDVSRSANFKDWGIMGLRIEMDAAPIYWKNISI